MDDPVLMQILEPLTYLTDDVGRHLLADSPLLYELVQHSI
jgi:hypothetical protein